jgi:Bacteriophage tail sheath protein
MIQPRTLPGVTFQAVSPPTEVDPLRSDVAGFIGPARRGIVGQPTRIEGWQAYQQRYGGLTNAATPYAIRGYFENDGKVAWVLRLAGGGKRASIKWDSGAAGGHGFPWQTYLIAATDLGAWGNEITVAISYRRDGLSGGPEVDLTVRVGDEPPEFLTGLSTGALAAQVAAQSRYIRIIPPSVPVASPDLLGAWYDRFGIDAPRQPELQNAPVLADPFDPAETPFATAPIVTGNLAFTQILTLVGGTDGAGAQPAQATLDVSLHAGDGFAWPTFNFMAVRPGSYANGTQVTVEYLRDAVSVPKLRVTVVPATGRPEKLLDVDPETLEDGIRSSSKLVRVKPVTTPPRFIDYSPSNVPGEPFPLTGGSELAPVLTDYLAVVSALGDVGETAIVAVPELHFQLTEDDDRQQVLQELLLRADELHDRLILIDLPGASGARSQLTWLDALQALAGSTLRNAAVYHPPVAVPDERGSVASPQRELPPCGHVAGVISRLDRERGAHYTPANAPLLEAVDLAAEVTTDDRAAFAADLRVNLLRCVPGNGLFVWGGRTPDPDNKFVAHRRLIHRLVRAIRRVAEPLVFDVNGPELWLALTRGITSVLLSAFRAGAFKRARPEEAFRVRCDESTNPPEERDNGRCLCEVSIAPAAPMEFILIRVALSADGTLEVLT